MLSFIKGKVIKKTEKGIIVLPENLGYFIHLTKNELESVGEKEEKNYFLHQQIREDSSDLYGFSTYEELHFFKQLININGIGPKVAMEIISIPTGQIKVAIINEDEAFLSKVPGIGGKTAKRLILEMKSKIEIEDLSALDNFNRQSQKLSSRIFDEAITALKQLGYQKNEINELLKHSNCEFEKTEEIVTYFLKNV